MRICLEFTEIDFEEENKKVEKTFFRKLKENKIQSKNSRKEEFLLKSSQFSGTKRNSHQSRKTQSGTSVFAVHLNNNPNKC